MSLVEEIYCGVMLQLRNELASPEHIADCEPSAHLYEIWGFKLRQGSMMLSHASLNYFKRKCGWLRLVTDSSGL